VTVKGIPNGVRRVLVSEYRIDETHGNAYTAWKEMGSPQQPAAEQYAKLRSEQGLQLLTSPHWEDVTDGAVHVETAMPPESVSLLSLRW
jgi:xylan 1,4-beta-xylosidase